MKVECKKGKLRRLMLEVMVVHEGREQERGWGAFSSWHGGKFLREP
jgi:hypothetical protein